MSETTLELRTKVSGHIVIADSPSNMAHDVLAAHCLMHAIDDADKQMVFRPSITGWIKQRAAQLLAEVTK